MKGLYIDKYSREGTTSPHSHIHDMYEVYYLKHGEMRYIIGDRIYNVRERDVALVPKNMIHNTVYDESRTERLLVNFSDKFAPKPELLCCFSKRIVTLDKDSCKEFEMLFSKILRESEGVDDYSRALIRSYICELMVMFERAKSRVEGSADEHLDENEALIQSAVDFINESFESDISLDTVSKKVSLSRSFFSRKFKEITGFGFSEYLNLVRVKNAAERLSVSNSSVTQVATGVGFNDSSYFCSVFKKHMGETPHKYAAKIKMGSGV